MATRIAVDSDTWWHLRAGAWMVEHRQVLTHEVFTSTFAGQPYDYPAWLSQSVMYLIFDRWGFPGLNLFTAGMVTVAFAFVYFTCTCGVYLRALAMILGAAASAVFWSARPHIVSFALAAAMLYVLELFRRRGVNRLWALPVLIAVWANTHPGYAIGFILIAGTPVHGPLPKTRALITLRRLLPDAGWDWFVRRALKWQQIGVGAHHLDRVSA